MTTYYWVASAAANFSSTTSWSIVGSGGVVTAAFPGVGDTAVFDGHSAFTCTLSAAAAVQAIDFTGGSGGGGNFVGTFAHGAFTLSINSSGVGVKMNSSMTYTVTSIASIVTFTNTSGTAQLTSAGHNFAAIIMNGAAGTAQQQDNLSITAIINGSFTLTSGTWDCNNANGYTLTAGSVVLSGSTTRVFIAAGTITVGGNAGGGTSVWNATTVTNLTFTKNTAALVISGPNASAQGYTAAFGTLTYNALTWATPSFNVACTCTGGATFGAMALNPGWYLSWTGGSAITIQTAFSWIGTPTSPISFGMSTIGAGIVNPTISCPSGTCTIQWASLYNVTFSGGATFVATDILAGGVITGLTVVPPADASTLPALIATAVWTDLLSSSDFSTSASVGALLKAIANLQYTVPAIGRGTCTSGGSTTSVVTSAFAPGSSVTNQFAGRVILFDATTTTAALQGQAAIISASAGSAGSVTFTVGAMTTAPVSGDTFSVL